jgi:hypothetical protein
MLLVLHCKYNCTVAKLFGAYLQYLVTNYFSMQAYFAIYLECEKKFEMIAVAQNKLHVLCYIKILSHSELFLRTSKNLIWDSLWV